MGASGAGRARPRETSAALIARKRLEVCNELSRSSPNAGQCGVSQLDMLLGHKKLCCFGFGRPCDVSGTQHAGPLYYSRRIATLDRYVTLDRDDSDTGKYGIELEEPWCTLVAHRERLESWPELWVLGVIRSGILQMISDRVYVRPCLCQQAAAELMAESAAASLNGDTVETELVCAPLTAVVAEWLVQTGQYKWLRRAQDAQRAYKRSIASAAAIAVRNLPPLVRTVIFRFVFLSPGSWVEVPPNGVPLTDDGKVVFKGEEFECESEGSIDFGPD